MSEPAQIKLLVFDVDGVLTDGSIIVDDSGRESKRFYVRDGAVSPFGPDLAPDPTQISEPSNFSLGQCFQDVTI